MARNIVDLEKGKFIEQTSSPPSTVRTQAKEDFTTNDTEEIGNDLYVGKVKTTGEWMIQKINEVGSVMTITYANISNNSGYITYTSAWTNKESLTYERTENITL